MGEDFGAGIAGRVGEKGEGLRTGEFEYAVVSFALVGGFEVGGGGIAVVFEYAAEEFAEVLFAGDFVALVGLRSGDVMGLVAATKEFCPSGMVAEGPGVGLFGVGVGADDGT